MFLVFLLLGVRVLGWLVFNLLSGMTFLGFLGVGALGREVDSPRELHSGASLMEQPFPIDGNFLMFRPLYLKARTKMPKRKMVVSSYLMNQWGVGRNFAGCTVTRLQELCIHTCCPSFFNLVARRFQRLWTYTCMPKVRPKLEPELEPDTEQALENEKTRNEQETNQKQPETTRNN